MRQAEVPGSIVCASSPTGSVALAAGGSGAYSTTKGGISSLVRCMAIDYARYGIRVNAVVPGATETRLMWSNVPVEDIPRMRQVLSLGLLGAAGRGGPSGRLVTVRGVFLRHWIAPCL